MKLLKIAILLLVCNFANAQSFIGYTSDNYSGLHGVTLNPANIVNSKFRSEINLASASSTFNNDYFVADFNELFSGEEFDDSRTEPKNNNNFTISADVMGPSFMFNLSPKSSIGIITRGRVVSNINELSGVLFENVEDNFDNNEDFIIEEDNFTITTHGWAEFGLAYGHVLLDKEQHFLKGGVTLKYLRGLGNAYTIGSNLLVDYQANTFVNGDGQITSTGTIQYGSSNAFSVDGGGEFKLEDNAQGLGADLGFIYEWRKDPIDADNMANATYKLKLGVSVTDIGSINYKDADVKVYDVTNSINETQFDSVEDFEDKLDAFYTLVEERSATKVLLPTALHVTADYNLDSQFFLNFRSDLSLRKKGEVNTNTIDNTFTLTPRFERKWVSVYLPIGVSEYSGFQAGFGFRAGPLFIGSQTILTNLLSDSSKAANIYAGLKIPIYKKGKSYSKATNN